MICEYNFLLLLSARNLILRATTRHNFSIILVRTVNNNIIINKINITENFVHLREI